MSVRPIRQLPQSVPAWIEVEALTPEGDVRIFGAQTIANNEQRVVRVFADDNGGSIADFWEDLRIGSMVFDYGLFEEEVMVLESTELVETGDGGGGSGNVVLEPLAFVDDLRVAAGLPALDDKLLATSDDLHTYLGAPVSPTSRLALLSEVVTPGYSPYAAYGNGSLGEEWDVRMLASHPDGTALSPTVWVSNRGLDRSGVLLNPSGSGPTLQKDAFGPGKHALRFAGSSNQYAEISADPTRLIGQPFVVFLVAQIVSATTAQATMYSTGNLAGMGSPTGDRNYLSFQTTNGLYAYGGGQSGAVRATDSTIPLQPHVFTVVHDGQNSMIRLDGRQISATPTLSFGVESRRQFRLGLNMASSNPADIRVGHVLIYNTSALELGAGMAAIEEALKADWGISPEPAPAAPVIGTATTPSGNTITIPWSASSGASSYRVYRSLTPTVTTASPLVATTSNTSFTDTGLTAGTRYYYKVAAINILGEGPLSELADAVATSPSQVTLNDTLTGTPGTALTGRPGVAAGGNNFLISPSGTTAQRVTTSSGGLQVAYGPLTTSDNRAVATVVARGAANPVGVFCRGNLAMDSYYLVRANGTNVLEVQKSVAGTLTTLATSLGTFVDGDTLEIQAVGSTISAYRNGISLTSLTDTSIASGVYGGLRAGGNASQATFSGLTVADV